MSYFSLYLWPITLSCSVSSPATVLLTYLFNEVFVRVFFFYIYDTAVCDKMCEFGGEEKRQKRKKKKKKRKDICILHWNCQSTTPDNGRTEREGKGCWREKGWVGCRRSSQGEENELGTLTENPPAKFLLPVRLFVCVSCFWFFMPFDPIYWPRQLYFRRTSVWPDVETTVLSVQSVEIHLANVCCCMPVIEDRQLCLYFRSVFMYIVLKYCLVECSHD